MRGIFNNIQYKFRDFMQGRYGFDVFSRFLMIVSIIFFLLSTLLGSSLLYTLAFISILYSSFRCYSRNFAKRTKELNLYLNYKRKFTKEVNFIKDTFKFRKTHICFKCKNCKTPIRVPKKKGKIQITCPACKEKIIRNT